MVYFGDIGDNGSTVKNYFGRYGAPCPINSNSAEHMIDVVTGGIEAVKDKYWHQVWLDSPEHAAAMAELDQIVADATANRQGRWMIVISLPPRFGLKPS